MSVEYVSPSVQFGKVLACAVRDYGGEHAAPWLIILFPGIESRKFGEDRCTGIPQTRAVVDDFGSLVFVMGWM